MDPAKRRYSLADWKRLSKNPGDPSDEVLRTANGTPAGQCDCGNITNKTKKCLTCPTRICAVCNKCIFSRLNIQLPPAPDVASPNPNPFLRHESINARRILASCSNEICSDGLPVSMLGGTSTGGEKCQCSMILIDSRHTYHRGLSDAICKTSHYCADCIEVILHWLLQGNSVDKSFGDAESGNAETLREYSCPCGSPADFSKGAFCKLCNKPCKPLTLNDLASRFISQVHNGEEGKGQMQPTATGPGTVGWSGADPYYYLRH